MRFSSDVLVLGLPGGAHSSRASSRRPALRLETRAMSTPHKYPMISMREAMDIAPSRASPLPEERVGFDDAVGRVLSSDVVAPRPHPPSPASIMDGYAVRASDCPGALAVVAAARAGAPTDTAVGPGQATYITTGAPSPRSDAVVQVERVSVVGDVARVSNPVPVGANVRPSDRTSPRARRSSPREPSRTPQIARRARRCRPSCPFEENHASRSSPRGTNSRILGTNLRR